LFPPRPSTLYCLGYGTCSLLGLQPFIALDMELVPS
jgi:hypothetical protein